MTCKNNVPIPHIQETSNIHIEMDKVKNVPNKNTELQEINQTIGN